MQGGPKIVLYNIYMYVYKFVLYRFICFCIEQELQDLSTLDSFQDERRESINIINIRGIGNDML